MLVCELRGRNPSQSDVASCEIMPSANHITMPDTSRTTWLVPWLWDSHPEARISQCTVTKTCSLVRWDASLSICFLTYTDPRDNFHKFSSYLYRFPSQEWFPSWKFSFSVELRELLFAVKLAVWVLLPPLELVISNQLHQRGVANFVFGSV